LWSPKSDVCSGLNIVLCANVYQIDKLLLQDVASIWNQKKGNSPEVIKKLKDCWNETVNPYTTVLYMLENMNVFDGG
jgi:hypothetical protein